MYAANIGIESVDAFKAGNDVLLIPPDLDAAYRAMLEALRRGEISRERLDRSVRKILRVKASLELQKTRLVDVNALERIVGTPENAALAQRISDAALTLVRDNDVVLPLKSQKRAPQLPYQPTEAVRSNTVVVIFADDVRMDAGRVLERQIRFRLSDARFFYIDPRIASARSGEVLKAVDDAERIVAAVYAVPSPGVRTGGDSVRATDPTGTLLQQILDHAAAKTAVLAVGNPYLAQDFPAIQNYLCTFSTATVSELSAVKGLFGEIAIQGHLPVSIPSTAERGFGIQRPARSPE
jgi:beta-N-acetylhexosaminidase